jgi:cephalosporin hydroxylase
VFPFWPIAIAPVLDAVDPRRVVEIGALKGETTELLVDHLGPDVELHVVDPLPAFDVDDQERRFRGRYVFHRAISHDVLPDLSPVDVALIDGDHNWYTVSGELRMLADTAAAAGEPLPVLVMHDVCWPYGRRDLYYAPERIPDEVRQPHAQRGMRPGTPELLPHGGLSPTLDNALVEGGPRNGVMTALEDFITSHPRPVRLVVLPIYFGLAIVADEDRLAANPALADVLDDLEGAKSRGQLLELAESLRLNALVFQHNVFYGSQARVERGTRRYLDLLKGALLDEHYLDNEARLEYLTRVIGREGTPVLAAMRDPVRQMVDHMRELRTARRAGRHANQDSGFFPFATIGRTRLDHLELCLDAMRADDVPGDLVEVGTGRGGGSIFMRGYLAAHELAHRDVWVADPFRPDVPADDTPFDAGLAQLEEKGADLNVVRDGFARFDLLDERVRFLQGDPATTLRGAPIERLALLRVGADAVADLVPVLDRLYSCVSRGGFVIVDGDTTAVNDARARLGITAPLEQVDGTAVCWRKEQAAMPGPSRAPAAQTLDLSVVVVVYNMRREAERTLRSLSRTYQRGVDDLDYEVIVVENGSAPDQRLGDELVASYGPEFRYVDMGDDASRSPVAALNRGIEASRGAALALMIDGAHVLTPGVLRYGMLGLRSYEPAVVATQQWYVGPGQQSEAMLAGYDREYEDRLFGEIGWPDDGYLLFDVGHFIGGRDWFDGMWESNCLFVPRALLDQAGVFDEAFDVAGGGFANLDLYERVGSTPGVTVVSIIGEGSFHQVHGGTTTNQTDADHRAAQLTAYRAHYAEMRGRDYRDPGKPLHYVGSMFTAARRTRARRQTAPAFWKRAQLSGPDGRPDGPVPIPDDLTLEFVDAFWRSMTWRDTRWGGWLVKRPPTDLFAYQELISTVRPDWIVETGTGAGGRALFMATVCDLIGHGQVLTVDDRAPERIPEHARLRLLRAEPLADGVADEVREIVGDTPRAMLIFGLASQGWLVQAFDAYSPLVPTGSYVVFEDTITNGHPVWPGMGPGPMDATKAILRRHAEFTVDPSLERFGLTFNPGGFLKRVG